MKDSATHVKNSFSIEVPWVDIFSLFGVLYLLYFAAKWLWKALLDKKGKDEDTGADEVQKQD